MIINQMRASIGREKCKFKNYFSEIILCEDKMGFIIKMQKFPLYIYIYIYIYISIYYHGELTNEYQWKILITI